jgi:hypothetical protein
MRFVSRFAFWQALACATALSAAEASFARPVSYPGGWTLIQTHNGSGTGLNVHYTLNPQLSVGGYVERNRAKNYDLAAVQVNSLLHRWNGESSQANLYLKGGVGVANPQDSGEAQPAAYAILATDWETRRWFTSAEVRARHLGDLGDTLDYTGRVGFAPYIGDYGDLHTWLMLQAEHDPADKDPIKTTPLVRMFYGVALLEAGYTLETEQTLLNLVWRF